MHGQGAYGAGIHRENIQNWIKEDKLPPDIKKYGDVAERIFITI